MTEETKMLDKEEKVKTKNVKKIKQDKTKAMNKKRKRQ